MRLCFFWMILLLIFCASCASGPGQGEAAGGSAQGGAPVFAEQTPTGGAGQAPAAVPKQAGGADKVTANAGTPPAPSQVQGELEPEMKMMMTPDPDFLSKGRPAAGAVDYRKWKTETKVDVGFSQLRVADLSPNEGYILVMSGRESAVRIYTSNGFLVERGAIANELAGGVLRSDAAFWSYEPNGEVRYLVGTQRGIFLHDAKTGKLMKQLSTIPCWRMRWSEDGRYLVTTVSDLSTQTSRMSFYAVHQGGLAHMKTVSFDERVEGWDLSDDNRYLAVTHYPSKSIQLWNLDDGTSVWRTDMPELGGAVDISSSGEMVAVAGSELRIMKLSDPSVRSVYTEFGNNTSQVSFSPSSDAVAVSSYDGRVRILAADVTAGTPELIKTLRHGGTANVYSVVFSKDGTRLLTSSGDKTARIWR